MIAGKIRKLDLEQRTLVVLTEDGREITALVPESASISVCEPNTMGHMGGKLEDLGLGYLVHLDVHEAHEGQPCRCTSLVSIS